MLSASADGTLILWDAEDGGIVRQLVGHGGSEVNAADFSPDGRLLVSGASDNTIVIWDVATGEPIRRYYWATGGGVSSVAFSSDGQYVFASGRSGEVTRWRVDATLNSLVDWTHMNRYVPEPTCLERDLYRIEPSCD